MEEFLCIQYKEEDKYFSKEKMLKLLEFYKKYHKKIGSYEIKSKKKLWEVIAKDLSNEYQLTIPPSKCENKFKVLERNYKKTIDHNNQTGRSRKTCEFEEELDEIFEKKKNLKPILLLSSSHLQAKEALPMQDQVPVPVIRIEESQPSRSNPDIAFTPNVDSTPKKLGVKRKKRLSPSSSYKKRNDILLDIKNDLKSFYDKKEKREEQKLEIAKKRQLEREKRNEMAREYLDFLVKK